MTDERPEAFGDSVAGQAGSPPSPPTRGAVSLESDSGAASGRARNQRIGNALLVNGTRIGVVIPFVALLAMLVILLIEAIPAIRYNGFGFFTSSIWEPGNAYGTPSHAGGVYHLPNAHFGAWPLIAGTLESSALALVVGFPIAVGAAVLLVEKLPARAAAMLGLALEVLAGIPSAVIGIFGIFTFGPFLAQHIYPILTHAPNVPILNIFRGVPSHDGEGLLTGGLVLAVMIIPIVATTAATFSCRCPRRRRKPPRRSA